MARGPKKHLKRITAPKSWMLSKLGGCWAPRPMQGPHKLSESVPIHVLLRHRLKIAMTGREVTLICQDKEGAVRVDGKVRRDPKFPVGLMDVLNIEKSKESFRLLYDAKGRFVLKKLKADEAKFKICKIVRKEVGPNRIPYIVTNDARTIRFPHPDIDVNDTVKINIETGKVEDCCKFDQGNVVLVTGGNNVGRVGVLTHVERHLGAFDVVHVKDARDQAFATRIGNIFMIGKGKKPWISLPKDNGIWLNAVEGLEAKEKKSHGHK